MHKPQKLLEVLACHAERMCQKEEQGMKRRDSGSLGRVEAARGTAGRAWGGQGQRAGRKGWC